MLAVVPRGLTSENMHQRRIACAGYKVKCWCCARCSFEVVRVRLEAVNERWVRVVS